MHTTGGETSLAAGIQASEMLKLFKGDLLSVLSITVAMHPVFQNLYHY